jgi:hypothetical protein
VIGQNPHSLGHIGRKVFAVLFHLHQGTAGTAVIIHGQLKVDSVELASVFNAVLRALPFAAEAILIDKTTQGNFFVHRI